MTTETATAAEKPRHRPSRPPKGWKKGRSAGETIVRHRLRDAKAFTSSIRAYKDHVAAGLAERLAPGLLEGEEMPDHGLTLELAARSVEAAYGELDDAHERYRLQTARCNHLSEECDRLAAEELYPRAVDLRRSIDGVFGKRQAVLIHGFQGRIPAWREGLREHARRALHFLEDPESEMPEPRTPGFKADREAWIRSIRPSFEELEARLDQLDREHSERGFLCDQRHLAMQAFDGVLGEARAAAEALYKMAGLDQRAIKDLRAYYERRLLSRWARQLREKRKKMAKGAAAAATSRSAADDSPPKSGVVVRISTWLASRFKAA